MIDQLTMLNMLSLTSTTGLYGTSPYWLGQTGWAASSFMGYFGTSISMDFHSFPSQPLLGNLIAFYHDAFPGGHS